MKISGLMKILELVKNLELCYSDKCSSQIPRLLNVLLVLWEKEIVFAVGARSDHNHFAFGAFGTPARID